MKLVDYLDDTDRPFRVQVPDDCPPERYSAGVPVGPPDFDEVLAERGWPESLRRKLQVNLHQRGLFVLRDVLARPKEVEAAVKATLRADVQTIQQLYYEEQRR